MNKMPRSIASSPQTDVAPTAALGSGLGPLGVAALIIAALYVGREVFVPIALAILLSFVLAPLIRLLQHIHVPRAIAGEMEPKGMNIWIEQAQGGEPAQRTTDA